MSSIEQYVQAAKAALPWGQDGITIYDYHTLDSQAAEPETLIRDVLAWAARIGLLRVTPDGTPTKDEAEAVARDLAAASEHPRFTHPTGWVQLLESRDLVVMALAGARRAACGQQEVTRVEQVAARLMAWHRSRQGL